MKRPEYALLSFILSTLLAVDALGESTTDGLVCHLTFDGNALDSSDSARASHGTPIGDPAYVAGLVGQAVQLHANRGQYIDLGCPEDLQFGNRDSGSDFSVSLWIRIDTSETWPVLITNKNYSSKPSGNSALHTGWGIFLHTDKKLRWNGKDDENDALYIEHVGPALADSHWHHVAVTHERQGRAVA